MIASASETVTFLFSDIEGSTRLVKELRDTYPSVLATHRRLVRTALAAHGGREIDTQGDAFFAVFWSPKDAVRCALAVRASHSDQAWPLGQPVRVRIGIHTGHALPSDGSYTGVAVHRAARISATAIGNQILVSQATQTILEDEEEELGFSLVDLGERHLKDLSRPAHVYEVLDTRDGELAGPSDHKSDNRIMVLPFSNLSPDPADSYFADGLTEEVIERLAHVEGLRVIARTTAMHYRGTDKTISQIGRELDVGTVLECSVRKAGTRLRISAQLIESASEEHLWAARYDRSLDDVFAVQDAISEEIIRAISQRLSVGASSLRLPERVVDETSDMEAYAAFLQARKLYADKVSEATILHALHLFEQAVARDPEFVRARVGLAACLRWLALEGALPYRDSLTRAREELSDALRRNDLLAEAHGEMALLFLTDDESDAASREARRAVELNPSNPEGYRTLAQIAGGVGSIDEAVRLLEDAHRLDPLEPNVVAFLAHSLFYAGRDEEALSFCERFEHLVPFRINAHRVEYYLGKGDEESATTALTEMERLRPDNVWLLTYRGMLAARRREERRARECIEALDQLERNGSLTSFFAGFVHFALGNLEAFFDCLDRALEQHSLPVLELRWSPLFSSIRNDPRYSELMRRQRETARST